MAEAMTHKEQRQKKERSFVRRGGLRMTWPVGPATLKAKQHTRQG